MKLIQIIGSLFLVILSAIAISCDSSDDIIWDIYPVEIYISIEDKDGNNLLDPETDGNLIGQNFIMNYDGEDYPADWSYLNMYPEERNEIRTRAYMPHFYGLIPRKYWVEDETGEYIESREYRLLFGEFEGAKNQDLTFRFIVPGREGEDVIHIKHKYDYKQNKPKISNEMTLNGKKVKYGPITIVVDPKL